MLFLPQGPLSLTWEAKVNAYIMENRYMIHNKVLNRNGIRLIGLRRNWSGNRYGSFLEEALIESEVPLMNKYLCISFVSDLYCGLYLEWGIHIPYNTLME